MMQLSEVLRLVWINIVENKFKMMMTSLGVIVGAATIVIVIAIGRGGQADVADQFKNLNAGAIDVSVGDGVDMDAMLQDGPGGMGGGMPDMEFNEIRRQAGQSGGRMFSMTLPGGGTFSSGGGMPGGGMPGGGSSRQTVRLDIDDVEDIRALVPGLKEVTLLQSGETAVYGGTLEEEKTSAVVGVYEDYRDVSNLSVLYGRFIEETDIDYEDYVCVIGYKLAEEIFTYAAYAYGDYLTIDGKNYEIVGVLNSMGDVSSGISPDTAVYLPYTTAQKQIFGSSAEPKIAAVAENVEDVPDIMADIETLLTENHPDGFFDVADAGSAMEAASSSANTLALLLLGVASIVFIVGGIGIMNVMFVSVKERTSEIGLLKAIGCSKRTILLEFLLEACIISVIGGLVGAGVSFGLLPLVELLGMRVEASVWGYLLALAFAAVTGTVFGFYPAWKASRLVPIEAMNLE
ncbi:MAG TPA: ABC transporter permease [Feifaniaceae bacterium]|nr:ABC transporter permease [Feifaniaceae bacterium]